MSMKNNTSNTKTASGIPSRINKTELARKIKTDLVKHRGMEDISLTDINLVLEKTTSNIMNYLKQGKEIFWSGLGGFVIQKRKATMRRNPQNGKEIHIPAKEVVKMKLFKSFTDKCMTKAKKGAVRK